MARKQLAGLDARVFLRRHWQKKPLLARRALPQYGGLLTQQSLLGLAGRDDVQSRLVLRARGRWHVEHGPFSRRRLAQLPSRDWTLLVQGVDQVMPEAKQLLCEFSFIPYARLDDVMVSYAPPGGGVGPHYDSYDVFLLQIAGRRRWRMSSQRDLALVPGAPLRLLRNFRAGHERLLSPGDMLYLPPRMAHDGIAVDHCLTASIGFRAPDAQELGTRFLEFLQDELELDGAYCDADLRLQRHPAHIGRPMLRQVERMLARIDWTTRDVARFLGQHLTEPGPHVRFTPPTRPLALAAFAAHIAKRGLQLHLKTHMLFHGRYVFINGECCEPGREAAPLLRQLADKRRVTPPLVPGGEAARRLYQWYRAGYVAAGRHARAGHADKDAR